MEPVSPTEVQAYVGHRIDHEAQQVGSCISGFKGAGRLPFHELSIGRPRGRVDGPDWLAISRHSGRCKCCACVPDELV